jgi:hypothetical protein
MLTGMSTMSPRNPASDAMGVGGNLVSLPWKINYSSFCSISKSIPYKR